MLRLSLPALLLFAFAAPARAADTPDPLRLVPESSQLIVKVEKPRQLAEAVVALDVFKTAQNIPQAKAVLESANVRRVLQMLAYFEGELGAKWPELLDSVAGGGIAIGAPLGDDGAPILVIQGTDPKQTEKAFALFQRVVDEELARAGLPIKIEKETYKGFTLVKVGDFTAVQADAVIVISTKGEPVRAALDLLEAGNADGGALKMKAVQDARKVLPKDPLAWVCVDLVKLKSTQASKDFFENTRKDFLQMLFVGSTIDCVRRSDFVAIGLYQEKTGFRAALRLPAGRSEFTADYALHVPPKGELGSLPLLEPAGVVYSQSFYLDVGYMWKHRDTLINDEMRKGLEEGEKQLSKLLPGSVKIGEVLESWGPRHRLVVLNTEKLPYSVEPGQRLPGFAYVATMRDPKFGKGLDSILRSAGLIGTLQYSLKLKKETHDGIEITGYRFHETKPLDLDEFNVRHNFEPCFCIVDDQFVLASSFEVARKIIPEIKRTTKLKGSAAVWQGKAFGDGGADLLTTVADPLITETILGEGVGLDEAKQQVKNLAAYVKQLGTIRVEIDERDTEYRVDVVWEMKK